MAKLKRLSVDIILRYNSSDLHTSAESGSEFIMGLKENILWEKSYDICETLENNPQYDFKCQEKMQFCLKGASQKDKKNVPQNCFLLRVDNIVAHDEEEAWGKIENSIHDVCRTLSIQINTHNCNKHNYQPRVQCDRSSIQWSVELYEPYEKLCNRLDEPIEYIDKDGKKHICLEAKCEIGLRMTTSYTLFGYLNTDEFLSLMNLDMDEKLNFLMEEYFIALGSEMMTSKFFHMFAIIEFTEKEFFEFSNAKFLFSSEEADKLISSIKNILDFGREKSEQILSTLKGNLNKMTDIGRAQKLANILNKLGIKEIQAGDKNILINKETMQDLIILRNHYFHGDSGKENKKLLKIDCAVAELMEICLGIIQYKIADVKMNDSRIETKEKEN